MGNGSEVMLSINRILQFSALPPSWLQVRPSVLPSALLVSSVILLPLNVFILSNQERVRFIYSSTILFSDKNICITQRVEI